jgi:hypothetical protein
MKAKGETKRGLQFLHISDNMPRQSGTNGVTRRPPMPDAALKRKAGEPNVQVHEICAHTIDAPGTRHTYNEEFNTLARYDKEATATTLANYINVPETHHNAGTHADNTYDEELIATDTLATNDEEFVAASLAVYNEESIAVDTLTTSDKDFATLASYDEEPAATLATHDERFAAATLATYDEETTAVDGEPWGA